MPTKLAPITLFAVPMATGWQLQNATRTGILDTSPITNPTHEDFKDMAIDQLGARYEAVRHLMKVHAMADGSYRVEYLPEAADEGILHWYSTSGLACGIGLKSQARTSNPYHVTCPDCLKKMKAVQDV